MRWSALALPSALLVHISSLAAAEQVILHADYPSPSFPTLRRFTSELSTVLDNAEAYDLDIWQATSNYIDIYEEQLASLPDALLDISHNASSIPYTSETVSHDLEWDLTSLDNTSFHSTYHPQHEIDAFLHDISSLYPELASVWSLGHSGEGREIYALKLHKEDEVAAEGNREIDSSSKLGFVVVGALHAREWIATATAQYLAHALVANSSEGHSLHSLLDTYDFYIIPSPNPDGYIYTWEYDRFWYKNRQVMGPNEQCVGLDMNRNWGYKWKAHAKDGAQEDAKPKKPADPCSHWFPGHRAFESPEVNGIANFITTLPNVVSLVDLRSYGQMLSGPYSFSCKRWPKDVEDQTEAAHGALRALKLEHGTPFTTGRLCETLYPAPGNMIDWMYARAGIKYPYALHLRDTGTYGFALPPEWIRPVGEETAKMVEYLAGFIQTQLGR